MKKIIIPLVIVLSLVSCGASKTVKSSKKVIKGNWVLNKITYNQSGYGLFKATLFNDASKECLENTNWSFVPNNNTGVYVINKPECKTGERNFIFSIQEIDESTGLYDFLLKPTDAKGKSVTNSGFRLQLVSLSETSMQWKQSLSVEGAPFIINMNFTKLN